MTSERILRKAAAAIGNAALGALIGALLAAFLHVSGGSTPGMVTTIVLASALGGWVEGFTGAMCGIVCGAMMASFGHVICGSTIGVVSIIIVCALIAGYLNWNSGADPNDNVARGSRVVQIPIATMIYAAAIANNDHSHTCSS